MPANICPFTLPLTRRQFRDAIEKGLGRAILHARRFGLKTYSAEIERAYSKVLVYDAQCEWDRGHWLWMLLSAGKATQAHREAIFRVLRKTRDYSMARQAAQLVAGFAAGGDADAKELLYSTFGRLVGDHIAAEEILKADGLAGYLRLARMLGKRITEGSDPSSVGADYLLWCAEDELGAARARRVVQNGEAALASFWREARKAKRGRKLPKTKRVSWKTFHRFMMAPSTSSSLPIQFGRTASAADISLAFEFLLKQTDPKMQQILLKVFIRRPPPRFDPRLVQLTKSRDTMVKRRAFSTLAKLVCPEVRQLALSYLAPRNGVDADALTLFERNFRDEDGPKLFRIMKRIARGEDIHGIVLCLTDIGSTGSSRGRTHRSLIPAYMWGYERTPCAICRSYTFRRLKQLKAAPKWMTQEARWDSDELAREAVAGAQNGK